MKIVIPAYEPNEKIIKLVEQLENKSNTEIIIVNDGSSKDYNNIFSTLEKMNVEILVHNRNKGKGEAIKTGLKYLISIGENEGVVFADCDGQHTAADIIQVLNETKNNRCIVLGCRNFKGKIPLRSKFGNIFSRDVFQLMTGYKISDTQTGLRGYPADDFEWLLKVKGSRYEYEFNVLLELCDRKKKYMQLDIETIYEDNNKVSHFNPIKDSILIYKSVIMYVISSVLAAIIDFLLLIFFKNACKNLLISIILSRSISSIFNFWFNNNVVFQNHENRNILHKLFKYYSLVIFIMVLNYLILNFLYTNMKMNLVIAKILTEIVLYIFSFVVQKRFVFKKIKVGGA